MLPDDAQNSVVGAQFSTKDRDQDKATGRHCADEMQAGWWFSDCGRANPTGPCLSGNDYQRNRSVPSIYWDAYWYGGLVVRNIGIKLRAV